MKETITSLAVFIAISLAATAVWAGGMGGGMMGGGGGYMMHSYGNRQMWADSDHRGHDDQYRGQRRFDGRHQARRDDDHDRRPWGGGYMMHSHSFGDRPMWSDPDDRGHDGAFHGQSGFGDR